MSGNFEQCDTLQHLLVKLLDGELDASDRERLAAMLRTEPAARETYLDYMSHHSFLRSQFAPLPIGHRPERSGIENGAEDVGMFPPIAIQEPASGTGFFGNFTASWPMAYLVATVVMVIGLTVGGVMHVSQPELSNHQPAIASQPHTAPDATVVGRVTDMLDCKWGDAGRRPVTAGHFVSLGDQLSLRSGFLEITYDTGATVILQGPVTYEVSSASGGHLSIGKLTARLEKGERGERRGESREKRAVDTSPQPLAPSPSSALSTLHSSLFTISTPTAVVTDLGTEFGVEVDRSGTTNSYVFRGMVEVRTIGRNEKAVKSVRLRENEAATVAPSPSGSAPTVGRSSMDPKIFVRVGQLAKTSPAGPQKPIERWRSYSRQLREDPSLIAYYTFESMGNDPTVLANASLAGRELDGKIIGTDWVLGRLPGKYALLFHGPSSDDKVVLPRPERFAFRGAFTLAVWFRISDFSSHHAGLVTKGDQSWRLQQASEGNILTFDTNYGVTQEHGTVGKTPVNDNRWHLAVAVYEPKGDVSQKRLYIDGRLDQENRSPVPLHPSDFPVWIGSNSRFPDRAFHGWIDEVAIFDRALPAEEILKMFNAGNVPLIGHLRINN